MEPMDFKQFLYRLRSISIKYQLHVEDDMRLNQIFGALASLDDDDIHRLLEINFLNDLFDFLQNYLRLFYRLLGNDEPEKEVIFHFIDHILNLNICLRYVIKDDFNQFITQYGGEECARLRIEAMMKSYFADPYAVVHLTTGNVIIDIDTHLEPFVMNIRKKIKE